MVDVVREAIDPKHRLRAKPFAVWVGGPEDGEPKDIDKDTLQAGYTLIRTFERVGYQTSFDRETGYDKRRLEPVDYIYPIREVYDVEGKRGWRIYFNERSKP